MAPGSHRCSISASSPGPQSDSLAAKVCPATRREPVADWETLGQAQFLELAHVPLERGLLHPERGGQVGRERLRAIADQLQDPARPWLAAGTVHPPESAIEIGPLVG